MKTCKMEGPRFKPCCLQKKVFLSWKHSKHLQNHCNPDKTKEMMSLKIQGKQFANGRKVLMDPGSLVERKKNVAKAMKGVGK